MLTAAQRAHLAAEGWVVAAGLVAPALAARGKALLDVLLGGPAPCEDVARAGAERRARFQCGPGLA